MPKRRSAASADRARRAAARASRVKKSGSFAESYLSYLLARASHIVASGFHAKLKTWNLSVPEYRVVFCLAGADGLAGREARLAHHPGDLRLRELLGAAAAAAAARLRAAL